MRRSKILSLRWKNVDLTNRTAFLPDTKNGRSRTVPLSTRAVGTLRALPRRLDGAVFPITAEAVKQAWTRARNRAQLPHLHFHDLLYEATSRLAKKG